jgi:hypothetical protein
LRLSWPAVWCSWAAMFPAAGTWPSSGPRRHSPRSRLLRGRGRRLPPLNHRSRRVRPPHRSRRTVRRRRLAPSARRRVPDRRAPRGEPSTLVCVPRRRLPASRRRPTTQSARTAPRPSTGCSRSKRESSPQAQEILPVTKYPPCGDDTTAPHSQRASDPGVEAPFAQRRFRDAPRKVSGQLVRPTLTSCQHDFPRTERRPRVDA